MSDALASGEIAEEIARYANAAPDFRARAFFWDADELTRRRAAERVGALLHRDVVTLEVEDCDNAVVGECEKKWAMDFKLWQRVDAVIFVRLGAFLQPAPPGVSQATLLFYQSLNAGLWTIIESYRGVVILSSDKNNLLPEIARRCHFIYRLKK